MQIDYFLSGTMQEPIYMYLYIYTYSLCFSMFPIHLKCVSILPQFPCSLSSVGCAGGAGAVKARCGWPWIWLPPSVTYVMHEEKLRWRWDDSEWSSRRSVACLDLVTSEYHQFHIVGFMAFSMSMTTIDNTLCWNIRTADAQAMQATLCGPKTVCQIPYNQ